MPHVDRPGSCHCNDVPRALMSCGHCSLTAAHCRWTRAVIPPMTDCQRLSTVPNSH